MQRSVEKSVVHSGHKEGWSVLEFYVTCNDIPVIYVTALMCRRTEEEVVQTVGRPKP